jgi:glutamyl-tRNA synthetase
MRDQTRKLSKRDGDASYQDFIDKGYIKEAIINYIALLGWSPGTENEKFTLDELIKTFDIKGISKSPAIFDPAKLAWLSGEYIRTMTPDEFHEIALPWIEKSIGKTELDTKAIASLLQPRCERLSDIPEQIDFFVNFSAPAPELFNHKKMKTSPETAKPVLEEVLKIFESLENENFTQDNIQKELLALIERLELKNGQVLFPLRVALSGREFTPGGGVEIAAILGKVESIRRLNAAGL